LNANIEGINILNSIERICTLDIHKLIERYKNDWIDIED